jgi:hypothetical protein
MKKGLVKSLSVSVRNYENQVFRWLAGKCLGVVL